MKVFWTDRAPDELQQTFLSRTFRKKIRSLAAKIEFTLKLISKNPRIYSKSTRREGMRKAFVTRHNTLYYRTNTNVVEVLSFFSNQRDPDSVSFD